MQDQNNLFSDSDDRQENLFPDFSIASININKGNSSSESYLKSSPFGDESLFTSPKPTQFYEGNTRFIEILWFIGAPMIENNEEIDNEINFLKEVVLSPNSNSQPPFFDYKKYTTTSGGNDNSWSFRDNDFSGKAILNKILGYIDKEKVFLFTNGSGYARYSLYVPYSNDSRVSLNNVDKKYLQNNAAIIINQLDTDGLLIILNNLYASKRNSYVEVIYKVLAKEVEADILDNPNALYIINDFPIALLKYFKYKTLEAILFRMLKDYLNDDKEVVLLKLFRVFYVKPDFDAQHFLNVLLTEKINGQTAFQVLYDNMNDWGGENNFSKIIIELAKLWTLSDYYKPNLNIYKKYEPCIDLVYDQEIILGFRVDEYSFDFDSGNHIIMTKKPNPDTGSWLANMVYGEVMEEEHIYHPFQPVTISSLKETEAEDLKLVENVSIPAFYLKAFDDKGVWENFEKGVWLAADVIGFLTGIGNLAKLRYLIKTEKIAVIVLKTTFAVIEVASSTVSIGLALVENSKNKDVVNKIREYLFWAEICTLSADVLSSRILAKKASEASEVLTDYRKTVKNNKHLQEIDEFTEHLDEVAGGQSKKLFSIWRINLKEGKLNCVNCAIAVDKTLAGQRVSALPKSPFKIGNKTLYLNKENSLVVLELEYKKKFKKTTLEEIKSTLKPGQRGIVFGKNEANRTGHVFNVHNEKGVVKFLDGQTGRKANLNFDEYQFLPTNF